MQRRSRVSAQEVQLFGNQQLSIEDIVNIAHQNTQVQLSGCDTARSL